jgi:anti-sigma factor RsiW
MTDTQKIHKFAEQNMLVEKYLLGELSGADREDFEQHIFDCAICFEEVKTGQAFIAHVPAAPRGSMQWWQRIKDFFRRNA